MRQRGEASWELRVYLGTEPETGRRRDASRTVRGSKRAAQVALAELVAQAAVAPAVGARSTVAKLLGEWAAAASARWSASTVREVESVVRRHLVPHSACAGLQPAVGDGLGESATARSVRTAAGVLVEEIAESGAANRAG